MSEWTTLAGYYDVLMGQDKDRVTCPQIAPNVWAHLGNGIAGEDPCEYFDLNFKPLKYDYFNMFAQWFQVEWKKQRDGYSSIDKVRSPKISGPHISCWQEPFKLSTFDAEKVGFVILSLPNDFIKSVFFHYAQPQDQYMAPIPHCKMRSTGSSSELKINRTAIRTLLIHDKSGEDVLKQFNAEHGVSLCLQFGNFICSFIEKNGELYYRPIGRDYYIRIQEWGKEYYKPTPVLQVLSSLTDVLYDKRANLMVSLNKSTFSRWISRNIDGYFIAYIPSRAHITFDEPQYFLVSYYPFKKNLAEARPIR